MPRCLIMGLVFLAFFACVTTPAPHPRALEANNICIEYIARGDLTRAEVQCDLGIQFSPQYADLWVNKGLIALKRGQKAQAKELFIKALHLNQDQAQAHNNLGYIYREEQQFGKAHDNFQRALKVNPDYTEARYNLALTFRNLNQNDKAKKELRTIIEVNPNLADPYKELGLIAIEESELDVAVNELTKATQIDPQFVDAWTALGNTLVESGKPCDGKDAFSSCIEADANNIVCRNNIINAEKKCQLQDKALDDVKQRAAGQKTPESEYSAALKFRENGLVTDEERAYKRCLKYDPKYALCHFGLFEIFRSRSDQKLASVACKNFLKFAGETEFQPQVSTCQQYVRD
jgi:Tfp pilus assembly protein PilF